MMGRTIEILSTLKEIVWLVLMFRVNVELSGPESIVKHKNKAEALRRRHRVGPGQLELSAEKVKQSVDDVANFPGAFQRPGR